MSSSLTAKILVVALFLSTVPLSFGQSRSGGDWESLKRYTGEEVAVKPDQGKTAFGILRTLDDTSLEVVSEDGQVRAFNRSKVEKVWLAKLKGSRNTGKGALIGGAIGGGIGFATLLGSRDSGDGQAAVAVPVLAIMGAGIGAVGGFFSRKKNQKQTLIYKR